MKNTVRFSIVGILVFLTIVVLQPKLDASIPIFTQDQSNSRLRLDGIASWYSKQSPGIRKLTANNEVFDDKAMTCAMWGPVFNQRIRVTNKANGKSVIVRVNDRGPHARFVQEGRIIDLTKAAFSKIAAPKTGLIQIQLEYL